MSAAPSPPGEAAVVEFVAGGDPTAVSRLVSEAVARLVGDAEASLVVTELGEGDYASSDGSLSVGPVVEAAQTPPMLSGHRVVVARHLGAFGDARALDPLIGYLAEPLATTRLLLVWEKGAAQPRLRPAPAALRGAVEAAGAVCHSAEVGAGRAGRAWLAEQLAAAQVQLDRAATDLLAEHLGEDRVRVWAILDTLAGAYGPGSRLGAAEVAPFLGAPGTVPPWELTDAIGKGDIAGALACLQRLSGPEAMHPLQVLAILRNYVDRMLHLDGSGARDEAAAAEILREAGLARKGGSTYGARLALTAARRLGSERLRRAVALLADADLDMRGRTALDPAATLEVLVARLSQLNRR
ncbi:MAG: DNA polymerase III subunit delta [bacterium]|nr:DNA polymerase III subunit delta [bacterium]